MHSQNRKYMHPSPVKGFVTKRQLHLACAVGLLLLSLWILCGESKYHIFQATLVLIYAIAIIGINILVGYNGQVSLGHCAFYAIGAYTSAILIAQGHMGYLWTIPIAAVISFIAGFAFGYPASRLHGSSLTIASFGLAISTPTLLKYFEKWTGGVQGISLVKPSVPFNLPINQDQWLYLLVLGCFLVCLLLAWNILRGRTGRAIMAIRDNLIAAEAMGINVSMYKSIAFSLSAMFTGIAGALGAVVVDFVAPDYYSLQLSISLLVGVMVGGMASLSGVIIGAVFIVFVPNLTADISEAAPSVIFGCIILFFMYVLPKGSAGFLRWISCKIAP
jgi:branched-chain amino acid transport system permease protein